MQENDTSDVTKLFVLDNFTMAPFGTDEAILTPNPSYGNFLPNLNEDFVGAIHT